jgi:hypothetical protein
MMGSEGSAAKSLHAERGTRIAMASLLARVAGRAVEVHHATEKRRKARP